MDFSQLSKETLDLSEQIGTKQMQLLFDESYFCDDISLESSTSVEIPEGPGIAFFVDKSSGSFCLRGSALTTPELLEDRAALEKLNHRFSKAEKIHWFQCESYSQAQVIIDQMMNRRFPFEDEAICNISDPGATWWLYKQDSKISVFFKAMGRKEEFEKLGPLGDGEIAKYRWSKMATYFKDIGINTTVEIEDNFLSIEFPDTNEPSAKDYFFKILSLFSEGKNSFNCDSFSLNLDQKTLHLYLSELAAIRKLWILVERLILTGI